MLHVCLWERACGMAFLVPIGNYEGGMIRISRRFFFGIHLALAHYASVVVQ